MYVSHIRIMGMVQYVYLFIFLDKPLLIITTINFD